MHSGIGRCTDPWIDLSSILRGSDASYRQSVRYVRVLVVQFPSMIINVNRSAWIGSVQVS